MTSIKSLRESFIKVRNLTIELCEPLTDEDHVVQPTVDVSPPKWHLGHTTWFFENVVLKEFDPGYKLYHPDFNYIFNSYYESLGKRVLRTDRGNLSRPTVKEVLGYRKFVDTAMLEFFEKHQDVDENLHQLIEIGLHHEQQHQELLVTDIKYILGNNPLFPVYKEKNEGMPTNDKVRPVSYREVNEGVYTIGFQGDGFSYDNEHGVHKVFLHPFRYQDRLVTNGEYLQFIEDGGYRQFEFWLSEGWEWVKQGIKAPLYWFEQEGKWYSYTLHGYQPVSLAEPVTHISFYEADAFAQWSGKRLLTEFEWEVVAAGKNAVEGNFVDSRHFHPVPVKGDHDQLLGDVWEWTSSAYRPYPYYRKADGAIGEYNGKFMVNQMVLRGGSCATSANHIRTTYRNFFHPHLRWQFTGLRLAESL
jgi:ergothioneine biosynthesis protein EgtB